MFIVIPYVSSCALHLSSAYNMSEEYSVTHSNILGLVILSTFTQNHYFLISAACTHIYESTYPCVLTKFQL
jgi:hypothetical protein